MSDFAEYREQADELGLTKKKRLVDPELLAVVRRLPCVACMAPPPNHPHHVSSRASGGGDVAENLISLCPEHHVEWHQKGPGYMMLMYPSVRYWLEAAHRTDVIERASRE